MRPAVLLSLAFLPAASAADWKGKPDPAPKDAAAPADPTIDVAVSKFGFTSTPVFADGSGPFVALVGGGGSDHGVKVYDVRSGKVHAEPAGEFRLSRPFALAPDGSKLAAGTHGVRGAAVAVIDTATGKVLHQLPAGRFCEWVGFAGPGRLVVAPQDSDSPVTVYDLKTGDPVRTLAVGRTMRAVSPGGGFLAASTDNGVRVLALDTGDEVGTLDAPDRSPGGRCQGLAFSPDGKQLAALFGFSEYKLSVWSLADGKLVRTVAVDRSVGGGFDNKLEWAADGSAWLVGDAVLDPETGKELWKLPPGRGVHGPGRRLMAMHAAVAWEAVGTGSHEYRLRVVGKPKAEVAAVRDAVRAGKTALDAVLPPAKDIDLGGAKQVEVPLAGVDWAAKADAGDKAKVARQPVPLLFRGAQVEAAYVGRGERPAAVFELSDTTARVTNPESVARRVERVDLYTGRVTGRLTPPAGLRVIGAGPDTTTVLTVDPSKARLDAWSAFNGQHVAGWRPYHADPDAGRTVAFAATLAADKVLTVSGTGKVVLWGLPDLKPVYVAEVPGLALPTLTPGGKYLIGWQRTAFRMLDAATGEPAGDLLPGFVVQGGGPRALAVRPDGMEAATVIGRAGAAPQLVRWDLVTGKVTETADYGPPPPPVRRGPAEPMVFPGAMAPPPEFLFAATVPAKLGYAGGDHLFLDDRDLYSLKHKAAVWSYALGPVGDGKVIGAGRDGRVWYVAGADGQAALVAADLPSPEAVERIKAATDGPTVLIKPGAKLAVKTEFTGSGAEATAKKVVEDLKAAAAPRGLTIADAAELTLKLTATQKETDRVLDVYPGFRPPDGTGRRGVKVIELSVSAALLKDGKPVWTSPAEALPMRSPYEVGRPIGVEETEKAVYQRTWEQVPAWAVRAAVPRFLAVGPDGKAVTLPGRSQLTAAGVVPGKE